ncbi:MAG: hypothetical protein H5T73_05000 [Actinobacteria bacterium]|nr:hypothetical protein [Actinomycetota bacterium]
MKGKMLAATATVLLLLPALFLPPVAPAASVDPFQAAGLGYGPARAWGYNYHGQLGNGNDTSSNVPVQVSGLSGAVAVAAGDGHSLALMADGTVKAWGCNYYGQLGNGNNISSNVPVQVWGLTGAVAVAAGYNHSLALMADGTVTAWGDNSYGQLGIGSTGGSSTTPVQVYGLTGAVAVAGGGYHSLALMADGTVRAWGYNYYGQLGNGNNTSSNVPVHVSGLSGAVAVAGGGYHSLALMADGTVRAWGYNGYGELGNGNNTPSNKPVQVWGLMGAVAVAGGSYHSLALMLDGTVRAWGLNDFGQLGNGSTGGSSNMITYVSGITRAKAVAGGGQHSLALMADGTARAWGRNGEGQLGNGNNTSSNVPVSVSGLTGAVAAAGGSYHSLAIPAHTWYLAEGSTYGGMESWVCVQNPNAFPVTVDLSFMTETGPVTGPQDFPIPGNSRYSFLLNSLVPGKKDVSTKVISSGGGVVCERPVYGPGKAWAHDSVGVTSPAHTWYLAEGSTYGSMESWVCVQNPNPNQVAVDLIFMTETGPVLGPQNFPIPGNSRYSFLLNSLVPGKKDVSTQVISTGGGVVCERSVYGPGKAWAHDSVGAIFPSSNWYLAEGSTYGGMESWVCVQNPNGVEVRVNLFFTTETDAVTGPQNFPIPGNSRYSFFLNSLVPGKKDVSTKVISTGGEVVCERPVYGPGKAWAHDSVGAIFASSVWYLAEGSTYGGMESWVCVQNPYPIPVTVDLTFMTETGPVPGPYNFAIAPYTRYSFFLNSLVPNKKSVSTRVVSHFGAVVCERSVYGPGKAWAHDSLGCCN